MFCVGITGGIGTGKTMITQIFTSFGIPVYNADEEAKNIASSDRALKNKIIVLLGEKSYKNGKYNTPYVAQKVFINKLVLAQLNKIIHPAVFKHFEKWKQEHSLNAPYLIKESSILFESGSYKNLDMIIGVSSPKNIIIQRLQQYRHLSEKQIIQRMNNQLSEEKKLQRCNAIIYNNPSLLLVPQVWALHQQIIEKTI
ncbi:MAG: dephospho-CoA kinase [Chitinophagaceae bacterium]